VYTLVANLYLTQLSISYLTQAILTLAFGLYLVGLKNKTRPSVLLTLSMLGTAGFFWGRFIYKSLSPHSILQPYALFVQYLFVPLLVVPLVLFAYQYPWPQPQQQREYRIATITAVLGALISLTVTVQLAFFQIQSDHSLIVNFYILLGNLWVIVVLLRRSVLLNEAADRRSWLAKLWRPQGQAARGARAFGLVIALVVAAALPSILSEVGLFSRSVGNSVQTVLTLTAVFTFAITYFNFAPEPTSIAAKLVGITLFTVLTVLGLLSFVVAPFYERAYQNPHLPAAPQTIQFVPNNAGGYDVAPAGFHFRSDLGRDLGLANQQSARQPLPFAFPFYDRSWSALYVSDNGLVTFGSPFYHRATQFGQQAAIAPLLLDLDPDAGGAVFMDETANSVTITWHEIPAKNGSEANTLQLVLHVDGRITISYAAIAPTQVYGTDLLHGPWLAGLLPGTSRQPVSLRLNEDLPASIAAGVGIIEPYQADFYAYLHQRMLPVGFLVLIASLLVVIGIPRFYRVNLLRPLNRLVAGMEQVNSGDLEVNLPVRFSDEIGFVTQSFNGMVTSIKQADQFKDEFLANTSHELRTPLNGIIGLTESLLAGDTGPLSAEQAQNLEMIAASSRRLVNLVNDILDFSRLKHSELELHLRPTDLRTLAELVLALSEPLVQGRPLVLVNEVPAELPLAYADENRVQQILHNLVGNAVKFSQEGQITVTARTLSEDWLEVAVSDTGIGIATERLEQIFDPFVQGDGSTAREYGGTGLGLSITRQLVELHGGQIQVTSEVGRGSTFRFTLPLSQVEQEVAAPKTADFAPTRIAAIRPATSPAPATEPAANTAVYPFQVLVVDDEPINLQVLKNYLTPHGYQIITARDGPEALQLVQDGLVPDLVILDVMMPRMTGYETCQRLRQAFPPQHMPVIMLTARNQVYDLVEGFNAGANDYLTKPFSRDELLTRIRSHLQLSQTTRAYGRFVPSEILRFLNRESIIDVQLGDQTEQEMTVMFADVRDFTGLSETMTPQENFYFINTLLGRMGPLVRLHHGFIDKYMGDSIMALFPRQADDAVQAAIAMQEELKRFNQERIATEQRPIRMGIGIHTGSLMLGTIGEQQRMEGTAISDTVNTGARIEELTKTYGVMSLISEATLDQLADPAGYCTRFIDKVQVKGKQGTIHVYELFDTDAQRVVKAALKERFETAVAHYYAQEFETAVTHLQQVLTQLPDDRISQIYLERAQLYGREGVPPDWEGIT
jgi:signal transduction histidine kinase/class 3 adenylate cyclase